MIACGIGEVLWDVFPDGERFGGAALNFCANLQRLSNEVTLFSAVGDDTRGKAALQQMRGLGLNTAGIRVVRDFPTGIATVLTEANGEPSFIIPRPAAFDEVSIDPSVLAGMKAVGVDWIYYGTLLHTNAEAEELTGYLVQELHPARGFYDINLRKGQWNLELVQRLSGLASVMKLNEVEAETLFSLSAHPRELFSLEAFCNDWSAEYQIDVICVTLGAAGCMIYDRGRSYRVAGSAVTVCDTVGSGDAFAAAFLHGYHVGWPVVEAAGFANALGALVASRAGATPAWSLEEVRAIMATTR